MKRTFVLVVVVTGLAGCARGGGLELLVRIVVDVAEDVTASGPGDEPLQAPWWCTTDGNAGICATDTSACTRARAAYVASGQTMSECRLRTSADCVGYVAGGRTPRRLCAPTPEACTLLQRALAKQDGVSSVESCTAEAATPDVPDAPWWCTYETDGDLGACETEPAACEQKRGVYAARGEMTACFPQASARCVHYVAAGGPRIACAPTPESCELVQRALRKQGGVSSIDDCLESTTGRPGPGIP